MIQPKFYFRVLTFLFVFIIITEFGFAQNQFSAKILDKDTHEPISFATIILKNRPTLGGVANIDGDISLNMNLMPNDTLLIRCIGYQPLLYSFIAYSAQKKILFLEKNVIKIKEIIVTPKENPAFRIIRNTLKYKDLNNPDNIPSYSCLIYNKMIFELIPNKNYLPDSVYKKKSIIGQNYYDMLLESITDRKYLYPDKISETVNAVKVSGLQNPSFAPLTNEIQPFHIYHDYLQVLDKLYLNPISKGCLNKYDYNLTDTILSFKDSVFIIKFSPKKNSNFDGLNGQLFINSNKYAIQNIIAEPFDNSFAKVKIQQKYSYISEKQWFPTELSYEIYFEKYPTKELGVKMLGKSFIKDISINPIIDKKDFNENIISLNKTANISDTAFWNKHRAVPLSIKETNTYHIVDSISVKKKMEKKMHVMEKLFTGEIPIKIVDLNLFSFYRKNSYEKSRYCIDLHSNETISKYLSLGGYGAYSKGLKRWSYGANINVLSSEKFKLTLSYIKDLREPGYVESIIDPFQEYIRSYQISRMDHFLEKKVQVSYRKKYILIKTSFSEQNISTNFNYNFTISDADNPIINYHYSEFNVNLRFAYSERFVQAFGHNYSTGTSYPVIWVSYTKGLKALGSEYGYDKVLINLSKSFNIRHIGISSIFLEGGFCAGNLTYSKLFNGRGTEIPIFISNSFQTMGVYEFLSDRFVNLFYTHNFGRLLFKRKYFQPEVILSHGVGCGNLINKDIPKEISYKPLNKLYTEGGIILNNIFRINYFNIAYFGLGGGIFCKYGNYTEKNIENNLAFKLNFTMTF